MKLRFTILAIILALSLACLSGCGSKDDSFTVDYVGKAGNILLIVGQYQGETAKMDAGAFKDCTLVDAQPLSGDTVDITGTPEGYLRIMGGVRLTLKDGNGNTVDVEVKEGSKLKVDTSDKDAWRFLLPE